MDNKTTIAIKADINASVKKVWQYWTEPKHIMKWNNVSDNWHTPFPENDLRKGGKFLSRMEALSAILWRQRQLKTDKLK